MKTELEDFMDKKLEHMNHVVGGSGGSDGDIDKDKLSRTKPKR